jgi:uncharacterized protein YndB with AHSA1/START domain
VKKVKSTKSKSAAKKAKAPSPAKKAKGKSSDKKAKASKSTKPVKKAVSKAVSKPTKKSSTVKKAAKPAKSSAAVKKKTAKPLPKKVSKKVVKPAKPAKAVKSAKPLKPAKAAKSAKASKPAKPAKAIVATKVVKAPPAKPVKAVEKQQKIKPVKEKAVTKNKKGGANEEDLDGSGFDNFEPPVKPKKGKGGRKPKSNDDDEPEIIHDDLIEQIIQTTKKQSKGPKKPHILQTFVNPINSLSLAVPETGKKVPASKKEPKGKFELEYVVRTSPGILYELLTTPSGLSEWFADDVNIRDGVFTFFWDGSEQKARLIGFKEEKYVRLQWLDKPDGTYFEFRIERDELTGDISLMIVDFAEEVSDQQTSKLLWDSQVNKLLNVLGSN